MSPKPDSTLPCSAVPSYVLSHCTCCRTGFVKHLKRKAGHPIEKLECWATFPARKIVNLVMDSPADDVVINVMAQWSITSGADMVVTEDEAPTRVWLWLVHR